MTARSGTHCRDLTESHAGNVTDISTSTQDSGGASFFEWGGQRRAKTFLWGEVYMVANNALPQCGTHILLYSKSPSLFPFDLSFLFASCGSFPFHLSFIPISRPSPPLIQLWVWGSAVSSPSGSSRQMQFGEFWA